jgi:hypothetical protein
MAILGHSPSYHAMGRRVLGLPITPAKLLRPE